MARRIIEEDGFRETLNPTASADLATYDSGLNFVARIVYTIVTVVEVLLAFRFVFLLFGANAANGFVSFIYNLSSPLVQPFYGIFSRIDTATTAGVFTFDLATLIAMAVYAVIAWLIIRLLSIPRSSGY